MSFNVLGIKFSISYPAIALLCLMMFVEPSRNYMIVLCLICSALHEAGHLIFIYKFSGKPESIDVRPGEVKINSGHDFYTYKQDFLITSAGIIFNLTGSIVSYLLYLFFPFDILFDFSMCNLCIGVFNLLPVKSFDGGQMLSILFTRKLSAKASYHVLNILTVLTVIPVATISFYILLISRYNYTLLIVAIYTITIILSKEMR